MSDFVQRYGGIYEHSPWVAELADAILTEGAGIDAIADAMAQSVDAASAELQLELIRAHPDLAGRAQVAGKLTADSASEQASAGLDRCSPAEFEAMQDLNAAYWQRFGFPFVMAVRGGSVASILRAFKERLDNEYETEFRTAIGEIHKIARLRLEALVNDVD
ncbi:MAG: 2-oxo-4-hydroxy-4-carboxy-5-ureidoimidazoline decarboxylase [Woeseiaceae bacterium]|nr:2-oxo-4-hydroxy-4-carboxy-5-ureidoimidazoline decarboxylase [Woeseiaceae bacterium]